jgi:hypothetical protein
MEIPTRRKESLDCKSLHTQASKDSVGFQGRSTFLFSENEQLSREEQLEETIKDQYLTFGSNNSMNESCFDSLDIYSPNYLSESSRMVQKLTCLQHIFS